MSDTTITLRASSGSSRVDRALQGLIGIFEIVFPGRIRAYHFMRAFKDFVLGELRGDDPGARSDAVWLLSQIPYFDDTIRCVLREIANAELS